MTISSVGVKAALTPPVFFFLAAFLGGLEPPAAELYSASS